MKISEHDFSTQIEDLLRLYQWRWCHWRPARTEHGWRTALSGDKGFPDYCCVRPPRLLFAELKDQYSKPSPEQEAWLDDLKECVKVITTVPIEKGKSLSYYDANKSGTLIIPEVYLWRPSMIDEIAECLK